MRVRSSGWFHELTADAQSWLTDRPEYSFGSAATISLPLVLAKPHLSFRTTWLAACLASPLGCAQVPQTRPPAQSEAVLVPELYVTSYSCVTGFHYLLLICPWQKMGHFSWFLAFLSSVSWPAQHVIRLVLPGLDCHHLYLTHHTSFCLAHLWSCSCSPPVFYQVLPATILVLFLVK